jgi:hypothetical protein
VRATGAREDCRRGHRRPYRRFRDYRRHMRLRDHRRRRLLRHRHGFCRRRLFPWDSETRSSHDPTIISSAVEPANLAAKAAKTRTGAGITRRLATASALRRKEFERAVKRIRALRRQGAAAFDDLYELVDTVINADPPLYLGAGFANLEAFIAKELPGEDVRSVRRNVLVARSFTAADEAEKGITFLEEAAHYAKELAGATTVPPAIDLDRLRVPVRVKNGTRRKTARQSTIDEIRQARRALRGGRPTHHAASPIDAALRKALGKNPSINRIAIRASATKASFGDVPLDQLAVFGRVIACVKLPKTEG